jgi:phosphotransferase family enzyme
MSMRTRVPLELQGSAIDGHPVLRAWNGLPAVRSGPSKIEVWRERKQNSIYRLLFEDGGMPAVFAKRCDAQDCNIERSCYEDILPRLPIASPAYFGSYRDADGTAWLFVEDVGREPYSVHDPEHRRLAGRWLGAVHRHGARVSAAGSLPCAGLERYRRHLRSGQERIRKNFDNRALTEADRATLRAVLSLLERSETRWDAFERALQGVPATFVHGDFQPKNIRIHREGPAPLVYAFDWEMAGWGIPAVDLAPANGHDLTIQVDLESYLEEVRREWPHLDAVVIRKQVAVGHILRRLAAIDWASCSLHFERADYLLDPVSTLQSMHTSLSRALDEAEEWLS